MNLQRTLEQSRAKLKFVHGKKDAVFPVANQYPNTVRITVGLLADRQKIIIVLTPAFEQDWINHGWNNNQPPSNEKSLRRNS